MRRIRSIMKSSYNEMIALKHDLELSKHIDRKAREYFKLAEAILNGRIEDGQYRNLLHRAVRRITCYDDSLEIDCLIGSFKLPRYMYRKYRNFPHFEYHWLPMKRGVAPMSLRETRLIVNYRCNGLVLPAVLADWQFLRIAIV